MAVKISNIYKNASPTTYGQQLALTPTVSRLSTNPVNIDVSTGSNTGTVTQDNYEKFLIERQGAYQAELDKINEQIEKNKQSILQQANAARDRAAIDARSSYMQNKSTYGTQAEQLAAMGLTGSGYSDYLNQQAYATQRAEVQNAKAQAEATKLGAEAQANSDKLNAELSYAENIRSSEEKLAQYQQQKQQNYASLLASATSGEYNPDQISALAEEYGFTQDQITKLKETAAFNEASQMISNYGADLESSYLEGLLSAGSISQDQYVSLKNQYIKASESTFKAGTMTSAEAQSFIESALKSSEYSDADKATLQGAYNDLYKIIQNGVKFNNDGGSTDMSKVGNNFSLIDESGTKYRIESGGEVTDETIKRLTSGVGNNSIFGLRGQIYYKKDGKIYLVQKRKSSFGEHYSNLYKKFFG